MVDRLTLSKHHGLGNDFLVALDPARPLDAVDARAWCARHRGVGADGLMVASSTDDPAVWDMVLFNADGSLAELSGNGLRCLAQAIARHDDPTGASRAERSLEIRTVAGARPLVVRPTDDPAEHRVAVDMGTAAGGPPPSDRWAGLGLSPERQIGVDLGNPHLVALVDEATLDGVDIATVGPAVEADHPAGCNVHLVAVTDRSTVRAVHWERGVGVTEACGSGACAAAHAARSWGLVDDRVEVVMPGGSAVVTVGERITLDGPAVHIADLEVAA